MGGSVRNVQDGWARDRDSIHSLRDLGPARGRAQHLADQTDSIGRRTHEHSVFGLGAGHGWVPRKRLVHSHDLVRRGVGDPLAALVASAAALVVKLPLARVALGLVRVLDGLEHFTGARTGRRAHDRDRVDVRGRVVALEQIGRDRGVWSRRDVHEARHREHEARATSTEHEHGLVLDALLRGQRVTDRVHALIGRYEQHDGENALLEALIRQLRRDLPLSHAGADAARDIANDLAAVRAQRPVERLLVRSQHCAQR